MEEGWSNRCRERTLCINHALSNELERCTSDEIADSQSVVESAGTSGTVKVHNNTSSLEETYEHV